MMNERSERKVCDEPNPTEAWLKAKAEADAKANAVVEDN